MSPQPVKKTVRSNFEIKAERVFVIDQEGQKLGEFFLRDAVELSKEKGFDLVEVGAGPKPTCKFMDLGKYLYQQKINKKEQRKNSQTVKVKELYIRPLTDIHDLQVRESQARKFLKQGNRVKFVMQFKGRENAHAEIGREKCLLMAQALSDVGTIESQPSLNGRDMSMFLVPISK